MLVLNASDQLAAQTRVQLLIALDQFPRAIDSIKSEQDETTLEQVYCLYKTGREEEAAAALAELPVEVGESRAAKLLEAQIVSGDQLHPVLVSETLSIVMLTVYCALQNYRLDKFETARDLYEDLIATAEAVSLPPPHALVRAPEN